MSKLQHWTTAELLKLVEAGMLSPEDRFELIDGEIVPVVPQGRRHEVLSDAVEDRLRVLAGVDVHLACRRQFNLAEDTFVKPDMIVCPAAIRTYDLRGDQALLVIEIGASSLIVDLGTKARLYAACGVPEYWVIDAERLATQCTAIRRRTATRRDEYLMQAKRPNAYAFRQWCSS